MGDSTCVMQSFEHSALQQQGDPVIRALGESVSFGRFVTETLEWEKWSTFNQNRYLEEAKRFSKPGLVAQKKALFEAHFKKVAADKAAAAAAALLKLEASSSSIGVTNHSLGKENPCKSDGRYSADAAHNSANSDGCLILDHSPAVPLLKSQFREACCAEKNDSSVKVSDFQSVNNSYPTNFVQMDEPSSDLAVDTTQDLELCDKVDAHSDTSKFNDMAAVVLEPSLFQKIDHSGGVKTDLDDLDRSEVVNNSTMLDPEKIAVQEPVDQSVLASTGKYKPTLTCTMTLASVRKPAVWSNLNPRPPAPPRKENDTTRNTRTFGSTLLNKKRVTTKSLHMSINFESSHQDLRRRLAPKKLDSPKKCANSISLRNSKECPDQVATETMNQKKRATASNTLTAIRKSSAEFHLRPAALQMKKDMSEMQRHIASMRNTEDMRKSIPKSLHMPINLDSHVGEKEKLVSLRRAGTKNDANSIRMFATYSAHATSKQVISDSTTRTKQIIPVLNSSTVGRKLIPQLHSKPALPPYKNINRSIRSNSAVTLSQMDINKSLPKSLHMSVDLSSTVGVARNPSLTQKRGGFNMNAPTSRASRDSSSRRSLKESIQTATILQLDDRGSKQVKTRLENTANGMMNTEKCPPQKMGRPQTPTNLIRPPSPTVTTPFRFRSDERAANRKEKLEEKYKVESENSLQRKGKFPSSRPQSPMYFRMPSPSKASETRNYKPPQAPSAGKASHQVPGNKTSTTSITLLPRKTACENASPNIEI